MNAVGFVGLGHMGAALARRLLSAQRSLIAYDLDPAAVRRVQAHGAAAAASTADVAGRCEVLFLCLPSVEASAQVAREIVAAPVVPRVVVETSTVGPAAVRALATALGARGIELVDAPVSGGPHKAESGALSVMCAATPAALALAQADLRQLGSGFFHVGGEPGLAQLCKLVNNAISAAGMVAACEAMVMGVKAGLDPQGLLDAVNAGSGRNAATEDKFPAAILPGTFDYGGPLGLMLKDLRLFIAESAALGVQGRMAPAALAAWEEAVRRSGPQADYSMVIRHMEMDAGVDVRSTPPHGSTA